MERLGDHHHTFREINPDNQSPSMCRFGRQRARTHSHVEEAPAWLHLQAVQQRSDCLLSERPQILIIGIRTSLPTDLLKGFEIHLWLLYIQAGPRYASRLVGRES